MEEKRRLLSQMLLESLIWDKFLSQKTEKVGHCDKTSDKATMNTQQFRHSTSTNRQLSI